MLVFSGEGLQVGDFTALQKQENSRHRRLALYLRRVPRGNYNGIKPLFLQTSNSRMVKLLIK